MLTLFGDEATELSSQPDETEAAFRARVQLAEREARDAEKEKLRQKYAPKVATLTERIRRAEQALSREQEQASESKMQTGISIGATIAGALLGRKAISMGTLGKATTAARGMGRSMRQGRATSGARTRRSRPRRRSSQSWSATSRPSSRARSRRSLADPTVHGHRDPAEEDPRRPPSASSSSGGPPSADHGYRGAGSRLRLRAVPNLVEQLTTGAAEASVSTDRLPEIQVPPLGRGVSRPRGEIRAVRVPRRGKAHPVAPHRVPDPLSRVTERDAELEVEKEAHVGPVIGAEAHPPGLDAGGAETR